MPTRRATVWVMAMTCVLVSAAACHEEPAATEEPFRIEGQWSFARVRSGLSCGASVVFMQDGDRFTGTLSPEGFCTWSSGNFRNEMAGPITEGSIVGDQVQFKHEDCTYVGRIVDDSGSYLSGTLDCPSPLGPPPRQVGTWETRK